MKLLIIEDEKEMRNNIVQFLEHEHFLIEETSNFQYALDKIYAYEYDCILLDIGLPDGNGLEILKALKKLNQMEGVIIISAKNSIDDKIDGLNLGADDYITKPFHMVELLARIKSVIRRKKFLGSNNIEIKNTLIDPDKRICTINKEEITLNRKEFDILLYLAINKGRLITRGALAEHVWGDYIDQADNFEFIYSQIKNLRKKLKTYRADVEIQAVYGIGYKLETE